MTPIGPYISPWTTTDHYIVSFWNGSVTYSVVPNGVQANEGIKCLSLRAAYSFLSDNGFVLKEIKKLPDTL
jgi:hypothetical protein